MKTDTPRTNKAFLDGYTFCKEDMMPAVAFASQLERELNAVTEQRDRLAEAIITHRAKAFPLNGEDYDLELWQALQSLTTNVEHIHPLPAGAEVDHGVEVQATENHGKETAGRGLDGAAC